MPADCKSRGGGDLRLSTVIFTMTAANIGIYYVFLSLFQVFDGMLPAAFSALFLGSAACSCGARTASGKPAFRFLFLLLPVPAFLLVHSIQQALLLLPAVLYPVCLILSGRFTVSYWAYRNHYVWSSCVLFLPIAISQTDHFHAVPLLFGVSSLILGTFTLRQLRFGQITGIKQKAFEMLSLCSVPFGIGFIVLAVFKSKEAAGMVAERVFYPLGFLMERAVAFFDSLIAPVEEPGRPETESSMFLESEAAITETEQSAGDLPPVNESSGEWIGILLILAAVAIVIWILVSLIRHLKDSRSEEILGERIDLKTQEDSAISHRPSNRDRSTSNRRKVRRLYEKYLRLLRSRHFVQTPQDSSLDILEKTRDLSVQEPAQALRELYIPARYNPEAQITDDDVREARRLFRRLRETPKR